MATSQDTTAFFLKANSKQFDSVLKLYPHAIKLKAEQRTKKPEELLKLDNWYQNELPKKIKSRGKDAHMVHEELVQLMKWKQSGAVSLKENIKAFPAKKKIDNSPSDDGHFSDDDE